MFTGPIASSVRQLFDALQMTRNGLRLPQFSQVVVIRQPSERSLPDCDEHRPPVSAACPALQSVLLRLICLSLLLLLERPGKPDDRPVLRDVPGVGRQIIEVVHKVSVAEIQRLIRTEASIEHY